MFILLEHSLHPLKLRDQKVIPSTIIPMDMEQLKPSEYISIRSGKRITVLNFGGRIAPTPEAKDAFYLSKVMPATLDESASNATDGDVFVSFNEPCKVELIKIKEIETIHWPDSINGYWISVEIYQNDQFVGKGWFRKNDVGGEILLLNTELQYNTTTTVKAMRALFKKTVVCECNGLESKQIYQLEESL